MVSFTERRDFAATERPEREDTPIVLHLQDGAVVTTHLSTLRGGIGARAKRAAADKGGHVHLPEMDSYSFMVVMNHLRGQPRQSVQKLYIKGTPLQRERVLSFALEHGLADLAEALLPRRSPPSQRRAGDAACRSEWAEATSPPHPIAVLESIRRDSS